MNGSNEGGGGGGDDDGPKKFHFQLYHPTHNRISSSSTHPQCFGRKKFQIKFQINGIIPRQKKGRVKMKRI